MIKPTEVFDRDYEWAALGSGHAERLRQIRSLLTAQGRYDTSQTKLLCFSAAGFKDSLRLEAATGSDLILVDGDELYGRQG